MRCQDNLRHEFSCATPKGVEKYFVFLGRNFSECRILKKCPFLIFRKCVFNKINRRNARHIHHNRIKTHDVVIIFSMIFQKTFSTFYDSSAFSKIQFVRERFKTAAGKGLHFRKNEDFAFLRDYIDFAVLASEIPRHDFKAAFAIKLRSPFFARISNDFRATQFRFFLKFHGAYDGQMVGVAAQ